MKHDFFRVALNLLGAHMLSPDKGADRHWFSELIQLWSVPREDCGNLISGLAGPTHHTSRFFVLTEGSSLQSQSPKATVFGRVFGMTVGYRNA